MVLHLNMCLPAPSSVIAVDKHIAEYDRITAGSAAQGSTALITQSSPITDGVFAVHGDERGRSFQETSHWTYTS